MKVCRKKGNSMTHRTILFGLMVALILGLAACTPRASIVESVSPGDSAMNAEATNASADTDTMSRSFTVRIENVSTPDTLQTSEGPKPVPLSPGVYAVHAEGAMPIFSAGQPDRGEGLEDIAEDGFPMNLAMSLQNQEGLSSSGVFNTPVGKSEPGPLMPGDAYEFTVEAEPGESLSFATMWVQSNDLFLSPSDAGISLFDSSGTPMSSVSDVTSQVMLWDAGTEVNEEPGVGPNTKPKQGMDAVDVGVKENSPVQPIGQINDGYSYPPVEAVVRVTITSP